MKYSEVAISKTYFSLEKKQRVRFFDHVKVRASIWSK